MFYTCAGAVSLFVAGRLSDRMGPLRITLIGVPLFATAFALIAVTRSITHFYILWTLAGLAGGAAAPVTVTRIINGWFEKHRGLALAVALLLAGLATSFLQLYSSWLVERYGWRLAVIGSAVLPIAIAWPIALLFLKEAPVGLVRSTRTLSQSHSTWRAQLPLLLSRRYLLLVIAIVCVTIGVSGLVINLKPLLADHGMSAEAGAGVAAAIGVSVAISRLLTGFLIDRVWAPLVAFVTLIMPAISCVILAQPDLEINGALVAAVLVGVGAGAEADLMPYLVARYFGLANYGLLFGALFSVFILVSGISPYLFGETYERLGSYSSVLNVCAGGFVIGAVLMLFLGSYPDHGETDD
jgi:MFS family permease